MAGARTERPGSLTARLTLAATVVLVVFLGLTALALERAWRESTLVAVRERLQAHLYALIAAGELSADGRMRMRPLADPRYGLPGSGRYAEVWPQEAGERWRSPSLMRQTLCPAGTLPPGRPRFGPARVGKEAVFRLVLQVAWEAPDGRLHPVRFCVAESRRFFEDQTQAYRRTLVVLLGIAGVMLLATQLGVLHWGLRPLRRVTRALRAVETGEREHLGVPAPRELRPLVEGIDRLIDNERAQRERYRHALDDLAHSLKTPLAVLRGLVERRDTDPEACRRQLEAQTRRMDEIIGWQLQRAVAAGRRTFLRPVPVRPQVQRLVETLAKVYRERPLAVENRVPEQAAVRCEADDLLEMLGNLLDNAFKYGRHRLRVGFEPCGAGRARLYVEDDGPGVPAEQREAILRRGVRMDESLPGQGIGLAATRSIAAAYGARLRVEDGALGGARFVIDGLPG
ncbi:MAG: histidine kinase [Gammaproteobacteria bacterium]|nr:MAG: histidine kinase [Gammaproteobacteria bacterium]